VPGGGTIVSIAKAVIGGKDKKNGAATAAKWSSAELGDALLHLRHGHTGITYGHSWLTPGLGSAARGGCKPGFYRNQAGTCSPYAGTEPVASMGFAATTPSTPAGTTAMPAYSQPPGGGRTCPPGTWNTIFGCINKPGGDVTGGGMVLSGGEAVMGQFGAALVPNSEQILRTNCNFPGVRGMVLGADGYCYNKSQISNKERMYPKGRRPLLTGGDMGAITKAARAAKRLQATQSKLQKMGMLKRPSRPRARAAGGPPRVTSVSDDSILRIGKG
jgi:hypothetical protein